jgi:SRSO17 transposase
LTLLSLAGQKFVAEVPVNFAVQLSGGTPSRRADAVLTAEQARRGQRVRVRQRTRADQWWRAAGVPVRVAGQEYVLVVAINEATAEVKYFLSSATGQPLGRLLAVAFCRATVEHGFRLGKQEAGLMHYEGRQYVGLVRHLILALIVMAFASVHTERLRGEKPAGDPGAGVPGAEPALRDAVPPSPRLGRVQSCGRGDSLSPAPQRASHSLPQEKAA